MTAKDKSALKAAKQIREYCKSMPVDCKGCIFNQWDSVITFRKRCLLDDSMHLPETWELERIKEGYIGRLELEKIQEGYNNGRLINRQRD